jgi:hypothetical protein
MLRNESKVRPLDRKTRTDYTTHRRQRLSTPINQRRVTDKEMGARATQRRGRFLMRAVEA